MPVTSRASRIAHRLASVADSVNDQNVIPNRRVELRADPLGVLGRQHRGDAAELVHPARATAAVVGAGECPAIAPVSPSAKSTYSWPSTSVIRLPCAVSR